MLKQIEWNSIYFVFFEKRHFSSKIRWINKIYVHEQSVT